MSMPNTKTKRASVGTHPAPPGMTDARQLIDDKIRRFESALDNHHRKAAAGVEGLFELIGDLRRSITLLDPNTGDGISVQIELHSILDEMVMKAVSRLIESSATEALGLARRDGVTGLPNRAAFEQHVIEEVERARSYGRQLSVIIFDVDRFKGINDRFGHPSGDLVLKEVAGVIRSSLRKSDMVFRYGGDEFAAICPAASDHSTRIILPRIDRRLFEHFSGSSVPGPVGVSAGAATFPVDGDDALTLVQEADQRLYRRKHENRRQSAG